MPRYNYECHACGYNLEATHRMSERLRECTKCGEDTLERIPSLLTAPKIETQERIGSIVETFIETAKEEVLYEKQRLKDRKMR